MIDLPNEEVFIKDRNKKLVLGDCFHLEMELLFKKTFDQMDMMAMDGFDLKKEREKEQMRKRKNDDEEDKLLEE